VIADIKPYPQYKDSGSRWLKQAPSHWKVRNLRTLIQPRNERNHPELPLLSVAREKGVFVRSLTDANENHNVIPEDLRNYKVARAGNLVINKMKAWQGSMGIAPCDGIVSPAYFVFEFDVTNHAFGQALLRSKPYVAHFGQASDGVRVGQWDLGIAGMKQIPVLLPPPTEQAAIVRFLNWANGRLERTIRAKRTVIALLNEQKQAIIHRAVTRGLDPSVPLKPSGVPWLGDIPQHWAVRRLKNLGATKIGLTYSPADLTDDTGCLVLRASNIKDGKLVSADDAFVRCRVPDKAQVRRGDILICARSGSRNLVGKSALIPESFEGVAFGAFMSVFRSSHNDFLYWVLNSNLFKFVMAEFETSTINQLTQENLNNIMVPIPPRQEQIDIIKRVEGETSSIEIASSRLAREIDLLREYRTRLVADVVTGKLDVREAAARLPDEALPADGEISAGEEDADESAETEDIAG